jgi:hypothetical protein
VRQSRTILVALVRDRKSQVNPPPGFVVEDGDQALSSPSQWKRSFRCNSPADENATGAVAQSAAARWQASFQVSITGSSRSEPRTETVPVDRSNNPPDAPGRWSHRAARTRSMCP